MEKVNWLPLTSQETTDLLEVLAMEIDLLIEKEYEALKNRLQVVYDRLIAEKEGKR